MVRLSKHLTRLALLAIVAMLPQLASAHDFEVDGIYYNINGNNATVTYRGDYSNSYSNEYSEEVNIPSTVTYNGTTYSVTSIGEEAFWGCSGLTSVTIPNSVTTIGDGAFYGCSGLTSVTIPNSVTSIGWAAFYGCRGLTSVTIPNSVTSIGEWAFYLCSGLTSVTIPISVTWIGDGAFSGCSGLTSVTIPISVTWIGNGAFYGCTGLTSVTWNAKNFPDFHSNGSPFYGLTGITSFIIGNEVERIPAYLCSGLTNLTSVTIGNSVTSIGADAFSGCIGLTSVSISDISAWCNIDFGVHDSNPLYYAHNLYLNGIKVTNLVIPNSVTSISHYAFSGCSGLESVTIGNSVTSIGVSAFEGCSGLESVTIGNSVITIYEYAFNECSNLTSVILNSNAIVSSYPESIVNIFGSQVENYIIGNSVVSIGDWAFCCCSALTSVTIPNSVTSIGDGAFFDCTNLTSVTIPNSVTSIGEEAFSGCIGMTSLTIGNSVTSIGEGAFSYCSDLTSVTIPNSVTLIPENCFYGCESLTSVTIPNSVTSIGYEAFWECSGLTSVTIPNSVTSIGESAFSGCSGLTSIVVESGNTKYDSRNNCNAIIETATNTLINGCMNTIIPNSVTSIGSGAFYNCSGLTSLTIPNSVTLIGDMAFYGCNGLTSVKWNMKNCSDYSATNSSPFRGLIGLSSFIFGNEVEHIPAYLCSGLIALTSVTIPNSVTSIGSNAFSGCSSLTSVTLTGKGTWNRKNNMPSINQLNSVNIGSCITSLGSFGFTPDMVNCYAETPPTCSSGTFSSYDGALHVPPTSTAAYFTTEYWQNFTNLNPDLTDKVRLNTTNANLFQWESLELTSTVSPEGGELIWSTTNPSIATVSDSGVVSFAGIGECDIYATLASNPAVYAICHITTSYPEITLSLSEESLAMNVGDEQTLTLTISPDNTGLSPTWSSSNTSVATVENGVVKAFGEGECDITATVLDKTATCHVTVINNVIITLNVENAILGANQILTVYPSCSPDVPVELVVTSSDQSVAVARVVNRTNAPALGLMSFPEKGMALAMMEELAVPSESKDPALASTKAVTIVGVQNGTATITVTTADGKATPAVLELRVVDVDGDRVVTTSDVTALYNYLLTGDDTFAATSDVNGDGHITTTDITVLYNLILGN